MPASDAGGGTYLPVGVSRLRVHRRSSARMWVIATAAEGAGDAAMTREGETTAARHGHAVRTSHAKSHGLLKGELRVLEGLPPELRQGLFAEPRGYPALVRLSNVPGEILEDSVSTQRGMAIKILEVPGERLPGHDAPTQDFVLDSGGLDLSTAVIRMLISWPRES